jgi:GntR family transcriptional regulator
MLLHLDPQDDLPLHAQLARQLRQAIASGKFARDRSLPSVRALARLLRINHQTVLRAYGDLAAEGLIERRQGQGTYVAPEALGEVTRQRQREVLTEIHRLATLARELGIGEREITAAIKLDTAKKRGLG